MRFVHLLSAAAACFALSAPAVASTEVWTGLEGLVSSMDFSTRSNTVNAVGESDAVQLSLGAGAVAEAVSASLEFVPFGRYSRSSNRGALRTDPFVGFILIVR